ncbi:TRAP transporter substrate-binding protein [Anaerosphaera multitolerans]|uniref:TRAP transporter substrate-binding protein n=1 Tax=Anaerosphaera multitolerans TaxID=2487351 RepID=A0A437S8F4_9FIRM|nr:TRAP transporter substrate-binding protein [Anaerosphaera multitolerans]RVU55211.1 TRAP transporter substrate-binding protein [Anaerosphaera multitolerans]
MKKMNIKKLSFILALSFMLTSLTGCLSSEERRKETGEREVYELYIACDSQEDTVTGIFMNTFADILEEKSNGRIIVNRYPNSQLGGDGEIAEAVQNGNITFVVQTSAPQVTFVPEAAIFDAPMAFKNLDVARKVLDGSLTEKLKEYYEPKKLRLLGIADQGFRVMTSNKRIENIDNLNGIKIRTMENPNHIAFWKSVGANPTPMAWSEVYIGLQQGSIDAQENPIETIVASKVYEQQDYVIKTNHILHTLTLIGSPNVIDDLPEELQKNVYEAADEAKVLARQQTDERSAGRIEIVEQSGTEILEYNEELFNTMKERSESVWLNLEKQIGKELVDLLRDEIYKAEVELGLN